MDINKHVINSTTANHIAHTSVERDFFKLSDIDSVS